MPQSSLSFPIISNSPATRVIPTSQQLTWLPYFFQALINLAGSRATCLTTRWNSFLRFSFSRQSACTFGRDGLVFTLIYSSMRKKSMRISIPLINVPIHPKSLYFLFLIMFRKIHSWHTILVVATFYLRQYYFPEFPQTQCRASSSGVSWKPSLTLKSIMRLVLLYSSWDIMEHFTFRRNVDHILREPGPIK